MARKTTAAPRKNEGKAQDLPSLRFYHSESLRAKTLSVLDAIEGVGEATSQRAALSEVVLELTHEGLDYYFVKPVRAAKVGFVAEQSTKLGIASILRVMRPITRRIIGGMDPAQLLLVSTHIRALME